MAVTFRARAGRMRPKAGFLFLGGLLVGGVLPAVAMLALFTGVVPLLTFGLNALLLGGMALSYGARSTKNARFDAGDLEVDDAAVRMDGRTLAARAELSDGYLVPTAQGTLVRLERRGPRLPIVLRVHSEAEGRALLEALGFGATHAAAEMTIASALIGMSVPTQLLVTLPAVALGVAGILTAAATLQQRAGPWVFGIIALMLVWILGLAFAPTTVRVGTDGVVTRWLWRERFIPFSSIAELAPYDEILGTKRQRGVRLRLHDGELVRLPTGQTDIGETEAARLYTRIQDAAAARRGEHVGPELLARGARPVADWVRALRAMGEGASTLRASSMPLDALLGIVEDAAAREVDRASAALAALASKDEDARRRVRVAAETTASPKLRVALDRIGDPQAETEAEAGALLEELDADARRA